MDSQGWSWRSPSYTLSSKYWFSHGPDLIPSIKYMKRLTVESIMSNISNLGLPMNYDNLSRPHGNFKWLCFIHRTSHVLNLTLNYYNLFSLLSIADHAIVKIKLVRLFKFNFWINRRTYIIYLVNKVHLLLRLVFTSSRITVRIISVVVRALIWHCENKKLES